MGYLYAGLWFLIAVLLIVRFKNESKVIYILSGYFAVMGVWWLANEIFPIDLMNGTYGWIFRIISIVMIVVIVLAYYRERKVNTEKFESNTNKSDASKKSS